MGHSGTHKPKNVVFPIDKQFKTFETIVKKDMIFTKTNFFLKYTAAPKYATTTLISTQVNMQIPQIINSLRHITKHQQMHTITRLNIYQQMILLLQKLQ